jgi:hypothetical protein
MIGFNNAVPIPLHWFAGSTPTEQQQQKAIQKKFSPIRNTPITAKTKELQLLLVYTVQCELVMMSLCVFSVQSKQPIIRHDADSPNLKGAAPNPAFSKFQVPTPCSCGVCHTATPTRKTDLKKRLQAIHKKKG